MKTNQTNEPGRRFSVKWAFAIILIASGVLLLARNFGWIRPELYDVLASWYMFLIVLGIYSFCVRHFLKGLVLLLIGGGFLAARLEFPWVAEHPGQIMWPVILILVGVSFLTKRKKRQKWQCGQNLSGNKQYFYTTDGFIRSDNSFGGVQQVILDEVFKGAELYNKFGGTSIDLRRTKLEPGQTVIDVDCKFGGIELYVPARWNVAIRCNAFMGACEDKRWRETDLVVDKEQTLVVQGNISFGGVVIKN